MRHMIISSAACFVGLSVAACSGGAKVTEFAVTQAPRAQVEVTDVGPKGESSGDVHDLAYNLSRDGQPAGYAIGESRIVEMPNAGGVDTGGLEERLSLSSYNLPEGVLMVVGPFSVPVGAKTLVVGVGESVTRPVVGGTKAYIGARGEVISTRQPDGSIVHQFRLIN